MIKSITLKNWKVHEDTHLEFQKGANILIGIMGAGKSSVMDAISFGLFGTFPALNSGRIKLDNLISNLNGSDEATVEVVFDVDGVDYKVKRSIKKGKSATASIDKGKEYLQSQPKRVNEEIESLLKLNYDTFIKAVYSEQNRLDYFLEMRKSDRKRSIDEMLGLDHFSTAEENITSTIGTINRLIKEDNQIISNMDRSSLESNIKELSSEMKKVEGEMGIYKENYEKVKPLTERLSASIKEEREKLNNKNKLKEDISILDSSIKTLKSEVEKLNVVEGEEILKKYELSKSKLDESTNVLKKYRIDQLSLNREITSIKNGISLDEKKLEDNKKIKAEILALEKEDLANRMDSVNKSINDASVEKASLEGGLKELKKWILELKKDITKCPVCDRDIDEDLKVKLVNEKTTQINDYESKIIAYNKKLDDDRKLLNELNSKKNKLEVLKGRLNDEIALNDELKSLNSKFVSKSKENDELAKKIDRLNEEIENLRKVNSDYELKINNYRRMKEMKKQIESSIKQREDKKKLFDSIHATQEHIDSLQKEYGENYSKMNEYKVRYGNSKAARDKLIDYIKDKTTQLNKLDESIERVSNRRNEVAELEKFKSAIINTEAELREKLVTSINELLQDLWPKLYPYSDYTNLNLKAYRDDYVLEAEVYLSGENKNLPIDTFGSGGEKSIACLCLRIALGMVIVPNLRWIILDEPTHNLDSAAISKLVSIFETKLPEIVEQIFIVTHDEALKNVHFARIYQLDRDKSKNSPSEVTEI